MRIENFTIAHIEQAVNIAMQNYKEERGYVPVLPQINTAPDLTTYAENNMSVAAFEGDIMLGFLCGTSPFDNAFGINNIKGIFSPMGANGAVGEDKTKIYARLYQAAAEKWVQAGATSHAICLYAHDKEAQEQFFRYGFGLRCVDAIRDMSMINCPPCDAVYEFIELEQNEYSSVFHLHTMLNRHQLTSPYFLYREPDKYAESFIRGCLRTSSKIFAVKHKNEICAYLRIYVSGETFVANCPGYIHIKSAYCLPEHRGKGVYQNLINFAISTLKNEGYARLGVDFESFNPTAYGFWLKYFTPYAYSVVRRIDEKVLDYIK